MAEYGVPNLLGPPPAPVADFDKCHELMCSPNPHISTAAAEALNTFLQSTTSFERSHELLTTSQSFRTRYLAVQIIEREISEHWRAFTDAQRDGIKRTLLDAIQTECERGVDHIRSSDGRVLLQKLNSAVVTIAKRDWPARWPTFVAEVRASSQVSEAVAENTLRLLRLLGEEVFEYGMRTMTSRWVNRKRVALAGEVSNIYDCCLQILKPATDPVFVEAVLQTLLTFIPWVEGTLAFLPDALHFFTTALRYEQTRDVSLKCLTALANRPVSNSSNNSHYSNNNNNNNSNENNNYISIDPVRQHQLVCECFTVALGIIIDMLPTTSDALELQIKALYNIGTNEAQDFTGLLCRYLIVTFRHHLRPLARGAPKALQAGHKLLVGITNCADNKDIFKMCAEYWRWLGNTMYYNNPEGENSSSSSSSSSKCDISIWGTSGICCNVPIARVTVSGTSVVHPDWAEVEKPLHEILKNVRMALISHMPRPEEVIVVEDEVSGDVRRVTLQDVEYLQIFDIVKEGLIVLTRIDHRDTFAILQLLTERHIQQGQSLLLSRLCWSAGALVEVLDPTITQKFFISLLQTLLNACQQERQLEVRALLAANIMYIAGQNTVFLLNHENFFRTVINKLFSFMRETHPGVSTMAVETFMRLCKRVPAGFVSVPKTVTSNNNKNSNNSRAKLIEDILQHTEYGGVSGITAPLPEPERQLFFEAIGIIIAYDQDPQPHPEYLSALMTEPNRQLWNMMGSDVSPEEAVSPNYVWTLVNVLRLHAAVAKTSGPVYLSQMTDLFPFLEKAYNFYSSQINKEVVASGETIIKHPHVRAMRAAKKEMLTIIQCFINSTDNPVFVAERCITPILELIVADYAWSAPPARDPTVLSLLTVIATQMGSLLSGYVEPLLNSVFDNTATMIRNSLIDLPDIRINFFSLLEALCTSCFDGFLAYCSTHPDVIECLLWAIQHIGNELVATALRTLCVFVTRILQAPQCADFFTAYLQRIIEIVLHGTMDKLHASTLAQHCELLASCFAVTQQVPEDTPVVGVKAIESLLVTDLSAIQNLSPEQIQSFVTLVLREAVGNAEALTVRMKDLLIEMDVWGAQEENIDSAEAERERGYKETLERLRQLEEEREQNTY